MRTTSEAFTEGSDSSGDDLLNQGANGNTRTLNQGANGNTRSWLPGICCNQSRTIAQRMEDLDIGMRKVDGPYDPNQEASELTLPPTVYTGVFVSLLTISNGQILGSEFFTQILPQIISYLFSVGVQTILVLYIGEIVDDKLDGAEACTINNIDQTLRILCLMVFVAAVMREFLEDAAIHDWVFHIPTWNPATDEQILRKAWQTSGLTNLPHQKWKDEDGMEMVKPATGFTLRFRFFIYLVLLPKLLIAMALFYFGTAHVLSSDTSEDMILNTLAVVFIFEIDDIIYQAVTNPLQKHWIATTTAFSRCEDEITCIEEYSFYINTLLFSVLCVVGYFMWC